MPLVFDDDDEEDDYYRELDEDWGDDDMWQCQYCGCLYGFDDEDCACLTVSEL